MNYKLLSMGVIGILLLTGAGCSDAKINSTNEKPAASKPEQHTELVVAKDFDRKTISDQVNKVIDKKFPGSWSVQDNILKKGDYTENNNYGIADEVAKNFPGSMVSLYAGITRVSNTVAGTNGRYLDYAVPQDVFETIKSGEPIFGEAKLNAQNYHKAYLPIKKDDKVIAVIGLSFKAK